MSPIITHNAHRPTVLIVLDGWGVALPSQANAISQAKTPAVESYIAHYPSMTLQASGEATGLPWNEVGNSEVGHMSIGAGRIIFQELSRINHAITNGSFFENDVFIEAIKHCTQNNSTLHLLGMASPGGVHSHIEHLFALIELANRSHVEKVAIHVILDGRDTPYAQGLNTIDMLADKLVATPYHIASICGRYYAMDRDHHWDRIQRAYRAIARGESESIAENAHDAVQASYNQGRYDEEFVPTVIVENAAPIAPVRNSDAVVFYNFRADRARQLTQAFISPSFDAFERLNYQKLYFATMTEYERGLTSAIAFQPQTVIHCLADWISIQEKKQIHIAETEKYAHITYFLNDGREDPFPNEERIMIPSPNVESYDTCPDMGARDIMLKTLDAIASERYDFIAVNFANADMVGHTGNMKATIKAIETVDECLKQIVDAALLKNGAVLITADHGNAESMLDLTSGTIDKEHSNNPVPCLIIAADLEGVRFGGADIAHGKDLSILKPSGLLSDVAPTVLTLMGLSKPSEMSGNSLLE